MKKLLLILIIFLLIKENQVPKKELIDVISVGAKLTKADAG